MKGAEIALVNGTRVTLGKGDACDIVIADASLADEALSLDVAESGVTMVRPDGSGVVLRPFETHAVGTTALAVGPADDIWEELRPAPAEKPETSETSAEEPVDASPSPRQNEAASDNPSDATEASRPRKKSHFGCLFFLLLIVLAVLVAFWRWREPILSFVRSVQDRLATPVTAAAPTEVKVSLKDLAREHGLRCSVTNGLARLSGNLKRRTERQALRALALAADRYCQLDLSDDESFKSAAEALLFTVTEGAVKVASAASREIALKGYAPDVSALDLLLEALRADVPWLEKTDAKGVTVGGPVPPELTNSRFATTGKLASASEYESDEKKSPVAASSGGAAGLSTNGVSVVSTNGVSGVVTNGVGTVASTSEDPMTPEDRVAALLVAQAERMNGVLPRALVPVAGILTRPYPCVVLTNGGRLIEGAKISGLEVIRIEAERVVFGFKEKRVRWEP